MTEIGNSQFSGLIPRLRGEQIRDVHRDYATTIEGALLVADVGEGRYVYTGLAFFRQLPAGVPGAYRLLMNLLALGE